MFILMSNRITTVILEINSRYIKAGFAGKTVPECIIPIKYDVNESEELHLPEVKDYSLTNTQRQDIIDSFNNENPKYKSMSRIYQQSRGNWLNFEKQDLVFLARILYTIWLEDLQIVPRSTKVVVVNNEFSVKFQQELCRILLEKLRTRSVVFVPGTLLTVIGSNRRNGLVLDFDWHSLKVHSVVDLHEISREEESTLSGEKIYFDSVLELLNSSDEVDFKTVEDLILQGKLKSSIPIKLVIDIIDKIMKKSEIDTRNLILENIVITGIASSIPELKENLVELITEIYPQAQVNSTVGYWTSCSLYVASIRTGFQEISDVAMINI